MAKKRLPALLTVTTAPTVTNGIFVGIDQSLSGTGVVCLDQQGTYIGSKLFSTSPGARPIDEVRRYIDLFAWMHAYVTEVAAGRQVGVVLEDFAFAQAHQMAALGGLGWHFRIMLSRTPWCFAAANPSLVKRMATGAGNAKKEQMILAVYKRWGFESSDNNIADAFVLAKLSWILYGKPLPGTDGVRKDDLDAATKITLYR